MLRKGIARLLVPVMLLTMLLSAPVTAGAASIKITGLTAVGTPAVGNTMSWTPSVTGGSGNYEFIYTLYKTTPSGTGYDYLPKTPGSYSITFTETGTYYLQVVAQDTKYDYVSAAYVSKPIVVVGTGPRIGDVVPNATLVQIGSTVQWTVYGETGSVGASGTTGSVTYEYSLYRKSDDLVINTLRSNPIFAYNLNVPGDYRLCVRGTDEAGTSVWYDTGYLVSAYAPPLVMESLTVSSALIELGETVTVTAKTHGGYKDLHYYWKVYKGSSMIDSFESDSPTIVYEPTVTGIIHFSCEVWDQSSQSTGEVTTVDVTVMTPAPFDITGITRTATKATTGKTIGWKIGLTGGQGTKTVLYTIFKNGSAIYSSSATTTGSSVTVTYFAEETGLYTIEAYAIDSKGKYTITNPFALTDAIVVYDGTSLYLSDLVGSPAKMTTGGTITWTWSHFNNKGGLKTTYTIFRDGTPVKTVSGFSGYIVKYTVKTGDFGKYTILIDSEDQVTGQTCSISGGLVDYSYSGALTFTSVVPVNASLSGPGYAEWLFTLGGDPMGKVNFTYEIVGVVNGTVASGSLSTTVSGSTASSSVKTFLSKGDTYTITLTATDDTPRAAAPYTGRRGGFHHQDEDHQPARRIQRGDLRQPDHLDLRRNGRHRHLERRISGEVHARRLLHDHQPHLRHRHHPEHHRYLHRRRQVLRRGTGQGRPGHHRLVHQRRRHDEARPQHRPGRERSLRGQDLLQGWRDDHLELHRIRRHRQLHGVLRHLPGGQDREDVLRRRRFPHLLCAQQSRLLQPEGVRDGFHRHQVRSRGERRDRGHPDRPGHLRPDHFGAHRLDQQDLLPAAGHLDLYRFQPDRGLYHPL